MKIHWGQIFHLSINDDTVLCNVLNGLAKLQKSILKQFWNHLYFFPGYLFFLGILYYCEHFPLLSLYKISRLTDNFTKYNQNQNSKMKFLGVLIGVAAAATAMSYDEKVMCLCCLDGFQWYCCATCLLTGGGDDRNADVQSKVAESLTSIQVITSKIIFKHLTWLVFLT